jgi:hypothetical protein
MSLQLLENLGASVLVGGITLPPLPGVVHGGWVLRLWWDEFPPVALLRYDLDMVLVFSDGVW